MGATPSLWAPKQASNFDSTAWAEKLLANRAHTGKGPKNTFLRADQNVFGLQLSIPIFLRFSPGSPFCMGDTPSLWAPKKASNFDSTPMAEKLLANRAHTGKGPKNTFLRADKNVSGLQL
jgi:hypothetical protein